jgi:hypothetical protein
MINHSEKANYDVLPSRYNLSILLIFPQNSLILKIQVVTSRGINFDRYPYPKPYGNAGPNRKIVCSSHRPGIGGGIGVAGLFLDGYTALSNRPEVLKVIPGNVFRKRAPTCDSTWLIVFWRFNRVA